MMLGNLTDLSRRPGMPSLPTLRELLFRHSDFPIVERGARGRGYVIDLEAAEHFVRQAMAAPKLERQRQQAAFQQLLLELGAGTRRRRHD